MEPHTEASAHDDEGWAAYWRHHNGMALEHARILEPPWTGRVVLAGGCGGLWRGYPWSIVWHLTLAADWAATAIRVMPDQPWEPDQAGMTVRFDGDRRWHKARDQELSPETRDGRFLAWEGSAFCHTPMLRHIGLDATDAHDVEVLLLNVFTGYMVAAPWRYTPSGEGRWHVEMTQTEQGSLDLVVDDRGIVTRGCGEFLLRHRPGSEGGLHPPM